ncbi:hypothetical protein F5Y15DRAFT_408153 [Xylariaceae sp. FL0016]|nr:hypothetical protein F5Y15DRAFT_408153 [Xylariaceae sp. FL0016]
MNDLPSYKEATTRQDWLELCAPYVSVADWRRCCLVNRRFYRQFAPRLWQDPLVAIRELGLHPNDDLAWYRRFINKYVKAARHETRSFVGSLDFRAFARRASGLYSTEASERAISEGFKSLPHIFSELSCLLLEGHPELDPGSLAIGTTSAPHFLQLLDLGHCRQELTSKLFIPDLFRGIVYLDVSDVPGSLRSAIQASLGPRYLPELRILKVRGREMDDATGRLLFQTFGRQLWSLDLGNNNLTDGIFDEMIDRCFSSLSFQTDAHFAREGKIYVPREIGSRRYGPFNFIQESQYSALFSHPEKYLADAPLYARRRSQDELQEWEVARSDGLGRLHRDDATALKDLLLDTKLASRRGASRKVSGDLARPRAGLTHLYLDGNNFTTVGVERLLRQSGGRLEHFECDSCTFAPATPAIPRSVRVLGLFSSSHLFRPVISSNLRSLRVHHSLVTQVPTIVAEGVSMVSALKLAEGTLFKNIRRAFPQAFEPNMNPRLTSLTLTNIPARSAGPIVERLIHFLTLLSGQRKGIKDAAAAFRGRGPSVLNGLQRLRLELEPDFADDAVNASADRDVDFDRLLDPSDDSFGFRDETWDITSRATDKKQGSAHQDSTKYTDTTIGNYEHWTSGRLKLFPYSVVESEYMTHQPDLAESWTGNVFSVPVWIGSGTIGPHAAVNEYMWNLQDARYRNHVGPATPNHVAAGVPPLSYIFHAAWDAMILPRHLEMAVKASSSLVLRDVATAIKEYRGRTRDTRDHWDGQIELVRASQALRYHSSEYWR